MEKSNFLEMVEELAETIKNDIINNSKEFVKAHNNFKNMKFRINSKKEDEKLQKYLFSLGYKWYFDFKPSGLNYNKFLYTSDEGIVYSLKNQNNKEYFDKHPYPECTLEELVNSGCIDFEDYRKGNYILPRMFVTAFLNNYKDDYNISFERGYTKKDYENMKNFI